MILTSERILLAVGAFAVFMFVQSKQRKASERYMQNLKQRQRNDFDRYAVPDEEPVHSDDEVLPDETMDQPVEKVRDGVETVHLEEHNK